MWVGECGVTPIIPPAMPPRQPLATPSLAKQPDNSTFDTQRQLKSSSVMWVRGQPNCAISKPCHVHGTACPPDSWPSPPPCVQFCGFKQMPPHTLRPSSDHTTCETHFCLLQKLVSDLNSEEHPKNRALISSCRYVLEKKELSKKTSSDA